VIRWKKEEATYPAPHLEVVVVQVLEPLRGRHVELVGLGKPASVLQPEVGVAEVAAHRRVHRAVVVAAVQVDAEQIARVRLKLRSVTDRVTGGQFLRWVRINPNCVAWCCTTWRDTKTRFV
jgi:hypothetical protein